MAKRIDGLRIRLMSPRKIAEMSFGEVVNAQTFDVYTQKPIKGGLFCQQLFGPIELGTCQCGKYRRSRRALVSRCEEMPCRPSRSH